MTCFAHTRGMQQQTPGCQWSGSATKTVILLWPGYDSLLGGRQPERSGPILAPETLLLQPFGARDTPRLLATEESL